MTARRYRLTLVGVCAALAVAIVAEAAWMMPLSDGAATQMPADAVALVDKLALSGLDSNIAMILERPLFSSSRAAVEMEEAEDDTEGEPSDAIDSRLSGIVIGAGTREALFQHESEKPVAVTIGDKVAGWTVAAIEPDHVELTRAGRTQKLSVLEDKTAGPRAAPKPKAPKKPTAAPRPIFPPALPQRPIAGRQAFR